MAVSFAPLGAKFFIPGDPRHIPAQPIPLNSSCWKEQKINHIKDNNAKFQEAVMAHYRSPHSHPVSGIRPLLRVSTGAFFGVILGLALLAAAALS